MPLHPELPDICSRIVLTLLASILIGLNRSEHGKPAGMRTIMLATLASCFAMLLANLLMDTNGKEPGSFVQLDMMRLPLGVLTGMGFIGGGTILRRGNLIVGVTTAATLWYCTILGFCFGAGHLALGGAVTVLGLIILWGVQQFEELVRQEHRATVTLIAAADAPSEPELRHTMEDSKFAIESWSVIYSQKKSRRRICCVLKWRAIPSDTAVPPFVDKLRDMPGIEMLKWIPATQ